MCQRVPPGLSLAEQQQLPSSQLSYNCARGSLSPSNQFTWDGKVNQDEDEGSDGHYYSITYTATASSLEGREIRLTVTHCDKASGDGWAANVKLAPILLIAMFVSSKFYLVSSWASYQYAPGIVTVWVSLAQLQEKGEGWEQSWGLID